MPKKEALNKLERPARDDMQKYTHCDGVYILLGIDLSGKLPVLRISQDGVEEKAYFFNRVPKVVKDEITRLVDESIEHGISETAALNMDCYFTTNTRKYCVILGIGGPRPDMKHYQLKDLPQDVDTQDIKIPGLS